MSQEFTLPNTLGRWPWARAINPHYLEVKAASSAWLEGFQAFSADAQRAFNACDFNLLASLAYPLASEAQLRVGADLMNLFFVFDEYSDVEGRDKTRELGNIIMDAMYNPTTARPEGETPLGEIARQFWDHARSLANKQTQERFLTTFGEYVSSVAQQSEDREHSLIRSIPEYFSLRRLTIGAYPSFVILEFALDLPEAVINHPIIQKMVVCAIDMLIIGNDICSYNVEQARGDETHNLVTVVMSEHGVDLNEALSRIGVMHDQLAVEFVSLYSQVPSYGEEIDRDLHRYVEGLGNWVRANDSWSFESARYFGKKGLDIQSHRVVSLLPRCST